MDEQRLEEIARRVEAEMFPRLVEREPSLVERRVATFTAAIREALSSQEEELRKVLAFIERRGYRRCDTAACNCGSFHGGHAEQRLVEATEELRSLRKDREQFRDENVALRDYVIDELLGGALGTGNTDPPLDLLKKALPTLRSLREERDSAFAAGFYARPKEGDSWVRHETHGTPREWDFTSGGSAVDLMSFALAAYLAREQDPLVTAVTVEREPLEEMTQEVTIPDSWELTGHPGDVMLRCGASVNVFAVSEQDIFVGGLPLPEWAATTGRAYVTEQLDGRLCVTLSTYAGDRIKVIRSE
jgi:hypothetical protein